MNSNLKLSLAAMAAFAGVVTTNLPAQTPPAVEFPAPSPASTLKQRVGLTDVEIVYSRPGVKGRKIFGGLIPYGEVWRTGANASTKISFSEAVKLNGTDIPAGKYALYTIPGEKEWTVIIYKDTSLWGNTSYKPSDELARIKASPVKLKEPVESFTIDFADLHDESATLNITWDTTRVPVKIETPLTDALVPKIEAAMSAPGKKAPGLCYQAAGFYYDHGQDLKKALAWVDEGLADKPNISFELLHLKAEILAKQGDKAGAIAAAKESTELALKAEGPNSSFARMNQDLISKLR
jgi:Protein of unknown function (DUF2911)